jgi:hypothetical protein
LKIIERDLTSQKKSIRVGCQGLVFLERLPPGVMGGYEGDSRGFDPICEERHGTLDQANHYFDSVLEKQ